MKKALITGITGQDGAYLAKFLLDKNYKVFGLTPRRSASSYSNLSFLNVKDEVRFLYGDVTDIGSLKSAIEISCPDEIYNLAAMSFVGASCDLPICSANVNGIGVLNLLECIKHLNKDIKFYQAGTSEMFGSSINSDGFQNETTVFHPRSPYGVSKVFGHNIVRNYRESFGIFACNGILFNHESPLRGKEFVTRKITDSIARILVGKQDKIELGNLDTHRDWGFAGDYVKAMWLMLQHDKPDDYVVATGQTNSIRYFLEKSFEAAGLGSYDKYIIQNPKYFRPAEVNRLKGDSTKAKNILNWSPETTLDDLIVKMVSSDIERVKNEI